MLLQQLDKLLIGIGLIVSFSKHMIVSVCVSNYPHRFNSVNTKTFIKIDSSLPEYHLMIWMNSTVPSQTVNSFFCSGFILCFIFKSKKRKKIKICNIHKIVMNKKRSNDHKLPTITSYDCWCFGRSSWTVTFASNVISIVRNAMSTRKQNRKLFPEFSVACHRTELVRKRTI